MSDKTYYAVAIRTYRNFCEQSSSRIRAKTLEGQGLRVPLSVECSKAIRETYPVGTVFIVKATLTDREGGTPFVYSHFNWPYYPVDEDKAEELIIQKKVGFFRSAIWDSQKMDLKCLWQK